MRENYDVILIKKSFSEKVVVDAVTTFLECLIKEGKTTVYAESSKYVINLYYCNSNQKKQKDIMEVTIQFQKEVCLVTMEFYSKIIHWGLIAGLILAILGLWFITVIIYFGVLIKFISVYRTKRKILRFIGNYLN